MHCAWFLCAWPDSGIFDVQRNALILNKLIDYKSFRSVQTYSHGTKSFRLGSNTSLLPHVSVFDLVGWVMLTDSVANPNLSLSKLLYHSSESTYLHQIWSFLAISLNCWEFSLKSIFWSFVGLVAAVFGRDIAMILLHYDPRNNSMIPGTRWFA